MKFKVTIQATVTKTIEVDNASSEQEACEIAHESFSVLNDENQQRYEQEVLRVEAVEKAVDMMQTENTALRGLLKRSVKVMYDPEQCQCDGISTISSTTVEADQIRKACESLKKARVEALNTWKVYPFNEAETIELFEFARIALADADTFGAIAEKCDLSDECLRGLRDKLVAFMDAQNG